MQRHRRQRKPVPKAKLNNFGPLLLVLRAELGPDWGFYKEFLEGAAAAKISGEDASVWVNKIAPLVQEPSMRFAHQGVLFLLGEMDVIVRSERETFLVIGSPSLPQHEQLLAPLIDNMAPTPPSLNPRHPPPASPSNNMQRDFTTNRAPMPPFNFKPSKPPTPASANFSLPSAASVAFLGEKRPTENQPFKNARSGGYVLHQDPAFRRDVQDFFGHTWSAVEPTTKYYNQADVPPVYKAADDDLAVWRAGFKVEGGVKDGGKDDKSDRVKSAEDKSREYVLEGLRYKLFNESP